MKELDPFILLAVFQEMLGPLLWILLAIVVLGLVAFVALLVREKGLVSRRLVRSEALGIVGGALALVLMAKVSSSGFTDAAGPADWFLIALVFGAGLVGSTILAYTIAGWWPARRQLTDTANAR
ncbi:MULTISPECIES: DUF5368 domain-containing protein [Comamonadaceae]|uniref:DUF5368 domain-containing protein n=1 Tax=Comamonadaceae TaxID=80864 RepID=UPI0003757C46|nr:DUF5368 domain-containing protein [Acidovorax sp. MR-S7]MBV2206011.1 DUF5368 domain-containing protein [Pseudomonas sp.]GAD20429.1 hypothetical protein AVS7_00190 [Acidovorax sp. MR-S7]